MNTLEMVREFHEKFGCKQVSWPVLDHELCKLRIKLLHEELQELDKALNDCNGVEIIDALTDLQYVLDGAYLAFGMDHLKSKAFKLVHDSNMKKLGPNGKPVRREDGKIMKPEGWKKPDLASLFK